MSNILLVSKFRNYNEVLKRCQVGILVFLDKNDRVGNIMETEKSFWIN